MIRAIDLTDIDLSGLDLSVFDRIAVWYGSLPAEVRTCLSVAIGAAIAYVVFKIVVRLIKGIIASVIAAVLAFLLTTVPGNMLLSQAYDRIEQQVTTSLHQ